MAQHDYVIANGTGAAVRSDLNNALAAIVSQNSGATAPSPTYAYQFWADTTTGLLKLRNAANSAWVTLFQLDGEWSTLPVENGTAAAPSIYFKDSGTDTGFYSPGTDQIGISTAGTSRLTIDANGNLAVDTNTLYVDAPNNRLGVGTSSPQTLLHLANTAQQRFNCLSTANAISFWKDGTPTFAAEVGIGGATGITSTMKFDIYNGSAWNTAMTIDSSSRVGIGTSSPDRLLHLSSTTYPQLRMVYPGQQTWDTGVESTGFYSITRAGQSAAITVDTSNRVGIGTASPSSLIHAVGTAANLILDRTSDSPAVIFRSNGTNIAGISTSSSNIRFEIGSGLTEAARIDSSGRLLVGTSSTSNNARAVFQAYQGDGNGPGIIRLAAGTSTPGNGTDLGSIEFSDSGHTNAARIQVSRDGGTWTSGTSQPTRLVFSTTADGASSPTERMRITKDGTFQLCGATVTNPGSGNTSTGIVFENASGGGTILASRSDNVPFYLNTNGDRNIINFQRSGGNVGSVSVTSTATAFNTSSDYRLKENVIPVADGIARLQQLKPSRFNFIADPDKTVDGFIAHEVQNVVPEAIHGKKDAVDDDGNPIYQGIDQSKLVPLLTAALQEAIGEIESLKARVAALESA